MPRPATARQFKLFLVAAIAVAVFGIGWGIHRGDALGSIIIGLGVIAFVLVGYIWRKIQH